jgi:hypothetical protein
MHPDNNVNMAYLYFSSPTLDVFEFEGWQYDGLQVWLAERQSEERS